MEQLTASTGLNSIRLILAVEMAFKAHEGAMLEGEAPVPYIAHPIEVLMNLRYVGEVIDPDMLCAAALHDTVEAEGVTLDQIERELGGNVRALVAELTRKEPDPQQIANMSKDEVWQMRADMLVEEISKMSDAAQQIKLADRLANVRAAHRLKTGKKLRRYLAQTKQILQVIPRNRNRALWDAIKSELP